MILGIFAVCCLGLSLLGLWRAADSMTIAQLKMSVVSSGVVTVVSFAVELSDYIKGV